MGQFKAPEKDGCTLKRFALAEKKSCFVFMFIGKACIRDRRSRRLKDTLFTKIQATTIYITFVCFFPRDSGPLAQMSGIGGLG